VVIVDYLCLFLSGVIGRMAKSRQSCQSSAIFLKNTLHAGKIALIQFAHNVRASAHMLPAHMVNMTAYIYSSYRHDTQYD
jgi:hypothetical protein